MRIRGFFITSLLLCFCFSISNSSAQIPAVKPDPLHPGSTAQGAPGCSATAASSCAQAAAKITPIVMGESPLEENLRRLTDGIGGPVAGASELAKAGGWGVGGVRAGGGGGHSRK